MLSILQMRHIRLSREAHDMALCAPPTLLHYRRIGNARMNKAIDWRERGGRWDAAAAEEEEEEKAFAMRLYLRPDMDSSNDDDV